MAVLLLSVDKAAEQCRVHEKERREGPQPEDDPDLEGHGVLVGAVQEVAQPLRRELGHVLVVLEPGEAVKVTSP